MAGVTLARPLEIRIGGAVRLAAGRRDHSAGVPSCDHRFPNEKAEGKQNQLLKSAVASGP
jgi:hypothetical protein